MLLMMKHGKARSKRTSILLLVLTLITVSIGGLVEIVPLFTSRRPSRR